MSYVEAFAKIRRLRDRGAIGDDEARSLAGEIFNTIQEVSGAVEILAVRYSWACPVCESKWEQNNYIVQYEDSTAECDLCGWQGTAEPKHIEPYND